MDKALHFVAGLGIALAVGWLVSPMAGLPGVQFRIAGRMVNEFAAHLAVQGMVVMKGAV